MSATTPSDEAAVEALCAALAPYPWRSFTPDLLARHVLAASDRRRVHDLLAAVAGAEVGTWERLEPAGRDDPRAAPVVELLGQLRWSEMQLPALCRSLLGVLRLG